MFLIKNRIKGRFAIGLLLLFPIQSWAHPDTISADSVTFSVNLEDEDGIYITPQQVAFSVHSDKPTANFTCIVTTDKHTPVDSLFYPSADTLRQISFTPPAAGFYRIKIYADNGGVKTFNVGYNPEQIVSPTDAKDDFSAFWAQTRAELDSVAPHYKMTLLKDKSSSLKKMYHIEMYSLGNVKIEGYYSVPRKKGKYPAIIHFQGYGADQRFPDPDAMPEYCELILAVRGQGIQKTENIYGEWALYGLSDKNTYYYRGAYMDLIRGIDFLTSRPEIDAQNILADGVSQGGAFTLAACALDNRIKAAAPRIPFLSDFRDYFEICPWPRSLFEKYLQEHPETSWEEIYDVLSYFDIKNMADRITCPIIMGVGLQDETCPPHTNFSGYNMIRSEKRYIVYPNQKHNVDESWFPLREAFFKEALGK